MHVITSILLDSENKHLIIIIIIIVKGGAYFRNCMVMYLQDLILIFNV